MAEDHDWPVVRTFDADHLDQVAMPLGGIGTGCVSLGGRGDLRDWEVMNRPAKGFRPQHTFFAIRCAGDGMTVARALEGPMEDVFRYGPHGSRGSNHGLPRFSSGRFEAAYPFGQVHLADDDLPVRVTIQAFNPLVPGDAEASGRPVAFLRYRVTNVATHSVQVSVVGSLQNFVGFDGTDGVASGNRNRVRDDEGFTGILMDSAGVDPGLPQWGSLALATRSDQDLTARTAWADVTWGDSLLDFWDDFVEDGRLSPRDSTTDSPTGSLCVAAELAPGETRDFEFTLAWHFPNRRAWKYLGPYVRDQWDFGDETIGNYYTAGARDAWEQAVRAARDWASLEARSLAFVRQLLGSDIPETAKDAALSNLSTLRTQTCFRTPDGRFYGWEGINDDSGSCLGSCTHVWNYDSATPYLFGELARTMRDVEFGHCVDETGFMSFRVHLPLDHAQEWRFAAADGQMGSIIKLYREWRLSGDGRMLADLWPAARRALAFAWIEQGWDADTDGVMEGCQHNTMDIEYFGPNPEVGFWYLGALAAGSRMARAMGDDEFAARCEGMLEHGRAWIDEHLFNGEYFEQIVMPPISADRIAEGLRHVTMGSRDLVDPDMQLGAGCLTDQLIGQTVSSLAGLDDLADAAKTATTMQSLMRYNFKDSFTDHFNHWRTYALGDESGMVLATYPHGNRPKRPFPYFNEVWTGMEYSAATQMVLAGQLENADRVVTAVRDRFDGRRRNPFNEPECGHHYARALASWGLVVAYSGFFYDAVEHSATFRARGPGSFRCLWSSGNAWGSLTQVTSAGSTLITIGVTEGTVSFRTVRVGDVEERGDWQVAAGGSATIHLGA